MEFSEAGSFIKKKRKNQGFNTQKSFIKALISIDPEINCSESYISLIESGAKSPSVHLLDVMAKVLNLTQQEKGELLLIYKRVPNDLEFAVRSNLRENIRSSNLDLLKKNYEQECNRKNFDNLIRALVLDGNQNEAMELLKKAPQFSDNFIEYQDRTAQMACISGNYDFAIQAFNLALESSNQEKLKSDFLMKIGICYFAKGLKIQYDQPVNSLENFISSAYFLKNSLDISDNIYCLDEYARCCYHIADNLQYFLKNEISIKLDSAGNEKTKDYFKGCLHSNQIYFGEPFLLYKIEENFKIAQETYQKIILHTERTSLPEKALKEAIYFHAYTLSKLGDYEQALFSINSILIFDQNWLIYFIKSGVMIQKFEKSGELNFLDEALELIKIALKNDHDTVKQIMLIEKKRELKSLWKFKKKEMEKILAEEKDA